MVSDDDAFAATDNVLDETLWDCFVPDDRSLEAAAEFATADVVQLSTSPGQGANVPSDKNFSSWELCAVGLQEHLPSQQAIDEL
jgi:hypothetical protein